MNDIFLNRYVLNVYNWYNKGYIYSGKVKLEKELLEGYIVYLGYMIDF